MSIDIRKRKSLRRRKELLFRMILVLLLMVNIFLLVKLGISVGKFFNRETIGKNPEVTMGDDSDSQKQSVISKPEWDIQFLTPNEYSRPQKVLEEVTGIVIHYVGNPGTTAQQNRDYFESLAETGETSASSHYVVGLDGEIIQCIPLNEVAYASRQRNKDTISIEVCHPTSEGWFNSETYEALIELVAWLVVEYDLEIEEVIRHYDVTGKICPKYYVENEKAWTDFLMDLENYINENIR